MSLNVKLSEQLFLIEILVHKVHLRLEAICDPNCACPRAKKAFSQSKSKDQTVPLRVKIKFINFPCVEINQMEFSGTEASKPKDNIEKEKQERDPGHFGTGKSFLFPMSPFDLIRGLKHFPLAVAVVKAMPGDEHYTFMGVTQVPLGLPEVCDTVRRVNQCEQMLPISSTVKDAYDLVNLDGEYVGYIVMLVRLSCFGQSIVTQFQLTEERSYLFRNTRAEEPVPCDKCEENLDYDPATYDVLPVAPMHSTERDLLDLPCCEASREGMFVERRLIQWHKVDMPCDEEEPLHEPQSFEEEYEGMVFLTKAADNHAIVIAGRKPCSCQGRQPLSMPTPEELDPQLQEPVIEAPPPLPWTTQAVVGPPGTVGPRITTTDAPVGTVAPVGRLPITVPFATGRASPNAGVMRKSIALSASEFMSEVGAVAPHRDDRKLASVPVGFVQPNPFAKASVPEALPKNTMPITVFCYDPRKPPEVMRLCGGGDVEPDHHFIDSDTTDRRYSSPESTLMSVQNPQTPRTDSQSSPERRLSVQNESRKSSQIRQSLTQEFRSSQQLRLSVHRESETCQRGPQQSTRSSQQLAMEARTSVEEPWSSLLEPRPMEEQQAPQTEESARDPWAPGGPWCPNAPWGASRKKGQPNPPIRYDTTGILSGANEQPTRRRLLRPRVVAGTMSGRRVQPPIRYDTTGVLSGAYKSGRKKLPSDIAEAVAAIKKGRPVKLKELKDMLLRLKSVEQPKMMTLFRPTGRYSYEWGSRYPGTQFGHRNCAPAYRRVSKLKGWGWDSRVPVYRYQELDLYPEEGANWRPGAICNSLKRLVRAPRRALRPLGLATSPRKLSHIHLPLDTGKQQEELSPEEPFVPSPTLHVHRYQGDFFVSMHPDEMSAETDGVPLQFRIINKDKKPITCQDSESELEIELFQPGAFLNQKGKTYSEKKTQCEERYFTKETDKVLAPTPHSEVTVDKGASGKSKSKKGKGKKGKGKKGKGKKGKGKKGKK